MNKTELIAAVAEKTGLSKKDSDAAVAAVVDAITESLVQGEKVQNRSARMGRNPHTKEQIEIPASKVPVFKAGKALKDTVAG